MQNFNESPPYIQHLLAEHRRLHKMLQTARSEIFQAGKADANWTDRILPALRQVREEVANHFVEEEKRGCLEEATSDCPKLSGDMRRIEAEHPLLLTELDRIIAQAADSKPTVEDRIALDNSFLELCANLHAHEAGENELLRHGFGTNINGDENDWSQVT